MWSPSFTNIVAVPILRGLWHLLDHLNKGSVNKVMGIPSLNFTSPPASFHTEPALCSTHTWPWENKIKQLLSDMPHEVREYYINFSANKEFRSCLGYIQKLKRFLVWYSEENANLLKEVSSILGENVMGVPYTVIGDTVNVASRIEAQNRQFNTQILISESTYEYAKDMVDVIKISSVTIRGREKHIDIYEIINILDTNEVNR